MPQQEYKPRNDLSKFTEEIRDDSDIPRSLLAELNLREVEDESGRRGISLGNEDDIWDSLPPDNSQLIEALDLASCVVSNSVRVVSSRIREA